MKEGRNIRSSKACDLGQNRQAGHLQGRKCDWICRTGWHAREPNKIVFAINSPSLACMFLPMRQLCPSPLIQGLAFQRCGNPLITIHCSSPPDRYCHRQRAFPTDCLFSGHLFTSKSCRGRKRRTIMSIREENLFIMNRMASTLRLALKIPVCARRHLKSSFISSKTMQSAEYGSRQQ